MAEVDINLFRAIFTYTDKSGVQHMTDAAMPAEYFDLQGRKVSHPEGGTPHYAECRRLSYDSLIRIRPL